MSTIIYELELAKPVDQFRVSSYHQQLGRRLCAAYIAQQQGIGIETALKKVSEPVGDLWLLLAELARLRGPDGSIIEATRIRSQCIKSVM